MNWEATVLAILSASLIRPFILVVVAAILLRVFRVEHPASKHAIWTAVLIGMLIVPVLSVSVPHFELQAFPEGTIGRLNPIVRSVLEDDYELLSGARGEAVATPVLATTAASAAGTGSGVSLPSSGSQSESSVRLPTAQILLWTYLAGLVGFAAYRFMGWMLVKRLIARSRSTRSPVVRESADVAIPITVGVVRPRILVPIEWAEWSATSRHAVLAHEIAHIRRRDSWTLALSRWVKCLFWFHPLAWWVSRKVSELAEMACDAAAVKRIGDPRRYSKILVEFAEIVRQRGYRATLPGLAMFGRSKLGRRVDAIFAVSEGKHRRLARPALIALIIGLPALATAATFGLGEVATRPLVQVQQSVAEKIESVVHVATSEGVGAALVEVIPEVILPAVAVPEPEPFQSAATMKDFVDGHCVACHNTTIRMGNFVLENQNLNEVQKNAKLWEKVVLRLRTFHELRSNANSVVPTAEEKRAVVEWLESELDRNAPPHSPAPGPHRLNRTEYGNAIQDLVGLDVNPALLVPSDDSQYGFDNIALVLAAQNTTAAYSAAADRLKDLALTDPASRQKILVCRPQGRDDEDSCARMAITNLATRAFRRRLNEDELNTLMSEFYKGAPQFAYFNSEVFEIRLKGMVRNILSDARFLYRTESMPPNVSPGFTQRISGTELASRLSYFLWSRGPDERLLDLAIKGQLSNPEILERETRRMLKDPRANALTVNFGAQWLWLRRLQVVTPAPYPDFDEPLRQAMQREVELFFNSIVQEDRNVLDLLTANYTFVNERLAQHYGIPNIRGRDFRRITLSPAFDVRRGLLGKAALLTVTSHSPERTSLTTRANWLLRTFLGFAPPDPPPNAPPLGRKTGPMRDMMQQHNVNPACMNCHSYLDPIGIAMDNFDQAGKWRTRDDGKTIDASAELVDGTKVKGPADLRKMLVSKSDQFVQTMTQKLLIYALGRAPEAQDMPLIRSITRDAARDGNKFSALVLGIVKSPAFQTNTKS